jgi:hypothetical protein
MHRAGMKFFFGMRRAVQSYGNGVSIMYLAILLTVGLLLVSLAAARPRGIKDGSEEKKTPKPM